MPRRQSRYCMMESTRESVVVATGEQSISQMETCAACVAPAAFPAASLQTRSFCRGAKKLLHDGRLANAERRRADKLGLDRGEREEKAGARRSSAWK